MAQKDGKWTAVIDGRQGPQYDGVALPTFSPDSQRLVYMAQKDGKWTAVIDGRQGPQYDGVALPTFSPDSRHLAYIAQKDGKWMVVIDGREGTMRFAGFIRNSSLVFDAPHRLHALAFSLPEGKPARLDVEIDAKP
jgi:hypothetical protein